MKYALVSLLLATSAHAETTITYMAWGSPAEGAVWAEIARAFEAGHPDINVNIQLSDWDSYWEKLRVQFAGGTPPDVFAMSPPLYPDWQSRGVLLNLQPYLNADPTALEGVYPVTLTAYQTPDGYFGLPRDFQTIVLYYNKDMFDAGHLPYPSADWTWDNLRAAAVTYAQPLPVFRGYEEWSTALGDTLNLIWTDQMTPEDGIAEAVAAGDAAIAKSN